MVALVADGDDVPQMHRRHGVTGEDAALHQLALDADARIAEDGVDGAGDAIACGAFVDQRAVGRDVVAAFVAFRQHREADGALDAQPLPRIDDILLDQPVHGAHTFQRRGAGKERIVHIAVEYALKFFLLLIAERRRVGEIQHDSAPFFWRWIKDRQRGRSILRRPSSGLRRNRS